MANLIIDIGSTALKASWADGITLGKTFRYQGENFIDFILSLTAKEKPSVMIVSTVREMNSRNEATLQRECGRLILLDTRSSEFVKSLSLPEYMSPDRAAAVVATRFLFKEHPCTIFDFGTTLAVDFLDKEGNYLGGNVSPGCRTRFRSINRYTRSYPIVNMPEDIDELGSSIHSSIASGVITGMEFEIEGYMARHPENIFVFSGGDANFFAKRTKNAIFVVCNLVLMGLALIADRNV